MPQSHQIEFSLEGCGMAEADRFVSLGDTTIRAACRLCPTAGGGNYAFSILLCHDEKMRALNDAWRGKDAPTNVLAFPADGAHSAPAPETGEPYFAGDIAISVDTLLREAAESRKAPEAHFQHLLVHAVLHLFGYDHDNDQAAEDMEALERRILDNLGIADPYAQSEFCRFSAARLLAADNTP